MPTTPSTRPAIFICAVLCLLFAGLSMSAVSGKSATYDEPLHVATGWLNWWRGDFRLSPDVPPLWEYWIALPLGRDAMQFAPRPAKADFDHEAIAAMYQTPGARGVELIARSRWMSILLALVLAALVAVCAGQIGGPVAAVAAMGAFVFDPNWLGHAPLAKNDVAFALVYFATMYAVWRVGMTASWGAVIAVVLLPAVGLGTKLSGLIVLPVVGVVFLIRCISPSPGTPGEGRGGGLQLFPKCLQGSRPICLGLLLVSSTLIAYVGLWAQYRFRFDAGPDGMQLDVPAMTRDLRDTQTRARFHANTPAEAQLSSWQPSAATEIVLWLDEHRLAPQAWAAGYLYTETASLERTAYLLGDVYAGSRWFYFPLAWVVKEPVALLVAVMGAAVVGWRRGMRKLRGEAGNCECHLYGWVALGAPPLVYLLMAIFGNVNIGLRHVFPVMPFVDVAVGLAAGKIWMMRRGKVVVVALGIALALETLAAYPDFISYFNVAAGGERGGLALLGDSNLDWGQDLPLLAQWQKDNPNVPLYLDYFGTADPAAYGIRYLNVPGGYVYGPPPRLAGVGVAAISATKLQGLFAGDPAHDFAVRFARQQPFAVLGGTIYLFEFQP